MTPSSVTTSGWQSLPANSRAAVWMLLAVLAFSVNNVSLKSLTRELDPLQIMFVRGAIMTLLLLPIAWRTRALATRRIGAHVTRAVLGSSGAYLFVLALSLAPVADVVALRCAPNSTTSSAAIRARGSGRDGR
jgi:drug/metabolite transporter (DMT)-like permease